MKTFEQVKKRYEELRAERDKYVPRWEEISKYVGIKVRPQRYLYADTEDKSEDLDKYTEDPTACLSVQQSADYLKGIMWGDGEGAFTLLPSDEVLDIADKGELDDWYSYATDNVLAQMNNSNAGLNSAMCAYFYDQQAYGTSGIGCFKNTAYGNGAEDNLLLFKSYGVDTLCVDEGKTAWSMWFSTRRNGGLIGWWRNFAKQKTALTNGCLKGCRKRSRKTTKPARGTMCV